MAWKSLCERHAYRGMSDEDHSRTPPRNEVHRAGPATIQISATTAVRFPTPTNLTFPTSTSSLSSSADMLRARSLDRAATSLGLGKLKGRPKAMTYRSHFKQKYQVETAWRTGGKVDQRQITPDQGVVTSLHLTDKYIIVALDNAKIHIFDSEGKHLRCLSGHNMGVWAMVPCGDTLVSGGCDRDVRVWDMATG